MYKQCVAHSIHRGAFLDFLRECEHASEGHDASHSTREHVFRQAQRSRELALQFLRTRTKHKSPNIKTRGRREDYEENWPWEFSRIDASFKSVEDAMGLETVRSSEALARDFAAVGLLQLYMGTSLIKTCPPP